MDLTQLDIDVYCDSGSIADMRAMLNLGVKGITSNPSLCRKAGVVNYLDFAIQAAREFPLYPISLEVIADNPAEIQRQARYLAELGDNVYVKVPIMNSHGESNAPSITALVNDGVQVNVTAVFTHEQIKTAMAALCPTLPSYISVFAGRIADTGRDPSDTVRRAAWAAVNTQTRVIWASVREPYNIVEATHAKADAITVFPEILRRLNRWHHNLDDFARETSEMFFRDAVEAGYTL